MPISAAIGPEWRINIQNLRTQSFKHEAQNPVAMNDKPVRLDLARRVPVADVPGKTRKIATQFHQQFDGRDDLHEPAIIQFKRITIIQADRFGQIDQKRFIIDGDKPFAAKQPLIITERDQIEDLSLKRRSSDDVCGRERGFSHAAAPRQTTSEAAIAKNLFDCLHARQTLGRKVLVRHFVQSADLRHLWPRLCNHDQSDPNRAADALDEMSQRL